MTADAESVATGEGRWKLARAAFIALGVLGICVGLTADFIGLGRSGSFGIGQILALAAGLGCLAAGLLGPRIVPLYRGVALVFFNSLLLLVLLELAAIGLVRSGLVNTPRGDLVERFRQMDYYRSQPWGPGFWDEAVAAESYRYEPYVVWKREPFDGRAIHVDEGGVRRTPGAECGDREGSYRVFAFGGSTLWGWGAPDWETIPAHLQAGLDTLLERPVCVVNLGEDSYVSTQEVIALLLRLQAGDVPDAVVFYDGFNDVYAAYETGRPGAHPQLELLASRFQGGHSLLIAWYRNSRLYSLVESALGGRRLLAHEDPGRLGPENGRRTADAIVDTYLANHRLVASLAAEHDFQVFFFWQPHIAMAAKGLAPEEREMAEAMAPELATMLRAAYARIEAAAPERERLWYLGDAFAGVEGQIWTDAWAHVTPEGNRRIAARMLDHMAPVLAGEARVGESRAGTTARR